MNQLLFKQQSDPKVDEAAEYADNLVRTKGFVYPKAINYAAKVFGLDRKLLNRLIGQRGGIQKGINHKAKVA